MTEPKTETELRHLRREVRTALELAIVALAPSALVDQLAMGAGYLEALNELPENSAPARALTPLLTTRLLESLEEWRRWQQTELDKKIARG